MARLKTSGLSWQGNNEALHFILSSAVAPELFVLTGILMT